MAKISKKFIYDLPDDYLYQTNDLDLKAEWTYDGPDVIWAFVDPETNRLCGDFKTPEEDGETYPTPLHLKKVKIDCSENPLLCTLLGADETLDYTVFETIEEELPDGNVYSRPKNPFPDHTYEMTEIVFDPETETFIEPYPWKKPHMDWNGIREWRNRLLAMTDDRILDDMPPALKQQWEDYRQQLRDLPQIHGAAHAGETPTTDPWKISPKQAPDGTE